MAIKLSPKSPIRAPGTMPIMVRARSIPTSVRQIPMIIIVAMEIANSRRNGSRIMKPMHCKSKKVNVKARYKGKSKSLNIRLPLHSHPKRDKRYSLAFSMSIICCSPDISLSIVSAPVYPISFSFSMNAG